MTTHARSQPSEEPPAYPHGLAREHLLELYYFLRLTRTLEERLAALYRQNKVIGGLYRSLGQEADAVGSAFALKRPGDMLAPLTRNLGSLLVMGAQPIDFLKQYMAKGTSPTRGREQNLHFADLELGFIGQISHLGDMVAVMAGVALSFRLRHEDRVALVYVGDGATSTGAFHEGLNFAAVQQLPLVVIAEYNGYAYSTTPEKQFAVKDLVEKAPAYGIPGVKADGNDVLAVYAVTKEAVERARAGGGVTFIELKTYRRTGHAEHDDQRYVPRDELEWWATHNDPLDRCVARFTKETGWFAAQDLEEIDARVSRLVDDATDACLDDPLPPGESALGGVFASPAEVSPHWYRRLDG
jgi:pyruvate dehydrogenase E1 component alpha subunit/2-oxoisovalerate dehydrogenase E1 component alpha subunit